MWESPIYKFQEEKIDKKGRIIQKPFYINVTYSAPRNLEDPGKALKGVFDRITTGLKAEKINILDVGAAKLRNTLWLLSKGFNVWAVEFPELRDRLPDAKEKWELAETFNNFHNVTFPKDFITLDMKFDIILLINVINVMPIPKERYILISLCREKIKEKGMLLWHQWRGLSTGGSDKYSEDNAFIDGYLMGNGPNHSFYVEHNRQECHEILYSVGFSFNKDMPLHKIPGNGGYSFVFKPNHEILIKNVLDMEHQLRVKHNSDEIFSHVESLPILELYRNELRTIKEGQKSAHKYQLIASRIFYEIFNTQINEPVIEREINEGRGRIDITYKNKNKEGIFKNLKDLRGIPCPEIIVECKNYKTDLTNTEYSQLVDRLSPHRGMLGFLLCRDKVNKDKVLNHCHDRYKGGNNKYIIVLDDKDMNVLSGFKLVDDEESINTFIEERIIELIEK